VGPLLQSDRAFLFFLELFKFCPWHTSKPVIARFFLPPTPSAVMEGAKLIVAGNRGEAPAGRRKDSRGDGNGPPCHANGVLLQRHPPRPLVQFVVRVLGWRRDIDRLRRKAQRRMHVDGGIAAVDGDRETLPDCLRRIATVPLAGCGKSRLVMSFWVLM
jgi:hypothetical protein